MKDTPGLHMLILGVAGNDELSKLQLYAVTEEPLIRHITKKFGTAFTQDDIREIYHQAYMQILDNAHTYRGKHGNPSAWQWAYQIARNQAHKWLRTRKRIVDIAVGAAVPSPLTDEDRLTLLANRIDPEWVERTKYEVEDQALERILVNQMFECFKHLNKRERQIFHMYHIEEMTMEEIAQRFGISRARICQVLNGAYKKCRDLIGWDQTHRL